MADLFAANAGLSSRFPHKFAFADYSAPQLAQIARIMLTRTGFALSGADADAEQALERLVAPIVLERPCGNARSVENRVAAAIAAQSTRLRACGAAPDGEQLFELTGADCAAAAAEAHRAAEALGSRGGEAPERQGRARG